MGPRPLCTVLSLFALGIWLADRSGGRAPGFRVGLVVACVALLWVLWRSRRGFPGPLRRLAVLLLACACVLCGALRFQAVVSTATGLAEAGRPLRVEGFPRALSSGHWALDLPRGGTVLVSRYDAPAWSERRLAVLWGRLRPDRALGFPGAPDFALQLRRRGISGWLRPGAWTPGEATRWRPFPGVRRVVLGAFSCGLRPATRQLLAALLLGQRRGLASHRVEAFRRAGMYHLLVVSGLHVSALVLAVSWLPLRLGWRRLAWLLAVGAALGMCALVDGQVSATRAALTCCCSLSLRRAGWVPDGLSVLSLVALCLLAASPGELFAPGFQLSFAAVGGLLLSARERLPRWLRNLSGGPGRLLAGALRIALTSGRVALATAPLLLFHFGSLSLVGVLSNIVAVPLAGLLLGSALLILPVALLFGGPPAPAVWLLELLTEGLAWLAEVCAALPGAELRVAPPSALWALCALLAAARFLTAPRCRWAWLALLACAGWLALSRPPAGLTVYSLRTGELSAVVVAEGGAARALGGPPWALRRFLASQGLAGEAHAALGPGRLETSAGPLLVGEGSLRLPGCAWDWERATGVHRWRLEGGCWTRERWGPVEGRAKLSAGDRDGSDDRR